MKILEHDKIDFIALKEAIAKPRSYQKSTAKFWDDPHISTQMLNFHLDPEVEAASKKAETIKAETGFIIKTIQLNQTKTVIDLGCGPGLYVDEFAKAAGSVLGIDLSQNSIDYACKTILPHHKNLSFKQMNYLTLQDESLYDLATLIYYDFGALNLQEQDDLLTRVHRSLKKNGTLVLDVLTDQARHEESMDLKFYQNGFWSSEPYVEIHRKFVFKDPLIRADQYTLIDESGHVRIIRNYDRLYTMSEITNLLMDHGFRITGIYRNLQGDPLTVESTTMGLFAQKI
jgi:ubiquinone/menaquinone biosynthesis C-methylase UbiE